LGELLDIQSVVSELLQEISLLRQENESLRKENAALRLSVRQLEETIALLKGGKNSRTSSTAPSQDLGRSNQISLRAPSGKKSGGQIGHAGHTLQMVDTPNEIIDHYPFVCGCCGESLDRVSNVSFTRRQIVDIPPVTPLYIEHRSHIKICPLCHFENQGVFPEHLRAPVQYGPQVEAMVGYLSVYHSIPYARITHLFKDFFKLNLSEGSVDNFLEKLSNKAHGAYEAIREQIQSAQIVGADETGCRVNGKKHWFHVWQNHLLTFIVSFATRGHQVIEKYFEDGFIHSFYVSDCWASQLKVKARKHQLCMAHLLRELTNFAENLGSEWSAKMKRLFISAIELKKRMTQNDYLNPPKEVAMLDKELDELLKIDCSKFHAKEQAFIKRLIKHQQSIFTFLTHLNVPPDNNASERAIRNVKVKTKVSCQFRNKEGKGADRYAKIRSVIDTTIKNGQDVYEALVCMANCRIKAT
jgi:transposase